MRGLVFLLFILALGPSRAEACLAREPIRNVVRASFHELRECVARHRYEPGTYVVQFEIDETGKVTRVAMVSGPTEPSPAAESCVAAVFTRMRFHGYGPRPAAAVDVRTGAGRSSAVPRALRRERRVGRIVVSYPLRLVP